MKLHKFVSNSRTVLESVPIDDRSREVQYVNLKFDDPFTRRGLLATVASIFDPLGFIAPFTLLGKRILRQLCIDGLGWDDVISDNLRTKWEQWLRDILKLQHINIQRCVTPRGFSVHKAEFNHFCDASLLGYGVCSYLRLVSPQGEVHVSLVLGKSRVTPITPVTIP